MSDRNLQSLAVRKLRKKLRQIENLQRLDRDLSEEECIKVAKKLEIRCQLQLLVASSSHAETTTDSIEEENTSLNSSLESSEKASFNFTMDDEEEEEEEEEKEENNDNPFEDRALTTEKKYKWNITDVEETPRQPTAPELRHSDEETEDSVPNPGVKVNDLSENRKESTGQNVTVSSEQDAHLLSNENGDKQNSNKRKLTKEVQNSWKKSQYRLIDLVGHNDLVTCVAAEGNILVSGSRDTMLKVWDLTSGEELRSLGGHTGSVTAACILDARMSAQVLNWHDTEGREGTIIVSGSSDCHICLWSLQSGQTIKSIYTYSPITCMAVMSGTNFLICGSTGGKVEIWNLETAEQVESIRAYEEAVTCIKISANHIVTSSADGILKLFELRGLDDFCLIFESENITLHSGAPLPCRHIHSLAIANDIVYYGDDGMNVKALDWRAGLVHKLANHLTEFGGTDSLSIWENLLLSSGYDIDSGEGYVNVRSLPSEKYLCTLRDPDTSRVTCLTCSRNRSGQQVIVTGGTELRLWTQVHSGSGNRGEGDSTLKKASYTRQYDKVPHNSDVESNDEWSSNDDSAHESDSDEDSEGSGPSKQQKFEEEDQSTKGWLSWCTLV